MPSFLALDDVIQADQGVFFRWAFLAQNFPADCGDPGKIGALRPCRQSPQLMAQFFRQGPLEPDMGQSLKKGEEAVRPGRRLLAEEEAFRLRSAIAQHRRHSPQELEDVTQRVVWLMLFQVIDKGVDRDQVGVVVDGQQGQKIKKSFRAGEACLRIVVAAAQLFEIGAERGMGRREIVVEKMEPALQAEAG